MRIISSSMDFSPVNRDWQRKGCWLFRSLSSTLQNGLSVWFLLLAHLPFFYLVADQVEKSFFLQSALIFPLFQTKNSWFGSHHSCFYWMLVLSQLYLRSTALGALSDLSPSLFELHFLSYTYSMLIIHRFCSCKFASR